MSNLYCCDAYPYQSIDRRLGLALIHLAVWLDKSSFRSNLAIVVLAFSLSLSLCVEQDSQGGGGGGGGDSRKSKPPIDSRPSSCTILAGSNQLSLESWAIDRQGEVRIADFTHSTVQLVSFPSLPPFCFSSQELEAEFSKWTHERLVLLHCIALIDCMGVDGWIGQTSPIA